MTWLDYGGKIEWREVPPSQATLLDLCSRVNDGRRPVENIVVVRHHPLHTLANSGNLPNCEEKVSPLT